LLCNMTENLSQLGIKGEAARSPFSGFIGNVLEERRPGYSRLSLKIEARHLDSSGRLHPGVLATMMDSALGAALRDVRRKDEEGIPGGTVAMDMMVLQVVREGEELVAEGRLLRRHGALAFGEAEVKKRGDGTLVACAYFVFAIGRGSPR